MELPSETAWMAQGNCADQPPSLFFPSDGVGVEHAKRICADCPVRSQCLEYAIENRIDHGVWGGTSERQRRRIIKARSAEEVHLRRTGTGRRSSDGDLGIQAAEHLAVR
jgi:WhiB family redox-sensing transcriptional regulator